MSATALLATSLNVRRASFCSQVLPLHMRHLSLPALADGDTDG
jgi:hypothetical protein